MVNSPCRPYHWHYTTANRLSTRIRGNTYWMLNPIYPGCELHAVHIFWRLLARENHVFYKTSGDL